MFPSCKQYCWPAFNHEMADKRVCWRSCSWQWKCHANIGKTNCSPKFILVNKLSRLVMSLLQFWLQECGITTHSNVEVTLCLLPGTARLKWKWNVTRCLQPIQLNNAKSTVVQSCEQAKCSPVNYGQGKWTCSVTFRLHTFCPEHCKHISISSEIVCFYIRMCIASVCGLGVKYNSADFIAGESIAFEEYSTIAQ